MGLADAGDTNIGMASNYDTDSGCSHYGKPKSNQGTSHLLQGGAGYIRGGGGGECRKLFGDVLRVLKIKSPWGSGGGGGRATYISSGMLGGGSSDVFH